MFNLGPVDSFFFTTEILLNIFRKEYSNREWRKEQWVFCISKKNYLDYFFKELYIITALALFCLQVFTILSSGFYFELIFDL